MRFRSGKVHKWQNFTSYAPCGYSVDWFGRLDCAYLWREVTCKRCLKARKK